MVYLWLFSIRPVLTRNLWTHGYCEQWGQADYGSLITDLAKLRVNFAKKFKDTNYLLLEMPVRTDRNGQDNGLCGAYVGVFDKNVAYCSLRAYCSGTNERVRWIGWKACGYLAAG